MALIVAIEGVDCAGKATQSKKLYEHLFAQFKTKVKLFAFPRYDGPCGDLITKLLKTKLDCFQDIEQAQLLQTLMLADRLDAIESFNVYDYVVCDRYYMSAIVYGQSDKLAEPWLTRMHSTMPQADLQFLIDFDPTQAVNRRGNPRDINESNLEKQIFVRNKYLEIWEKEASSQWVVIDGHKPEEHIHERIKNNVTALINQRKEKNLFDAAI
jgi:dTMP kinase